MIVMIWRKTVYISNYDYATTREFLGVPDTEITVWKEICSHAPALGWAKSHGVQDSLNSVVVVA